MLNLVCQSCKADYQKPDEYKKWAVPTETDKYSHYFFTRQLKECDPCRRTREEEMINKALPVVLKALMES